MPPDPTMIRRRPVLLAAAGLTLPGRRAAATDAGEKESRMLDLLMIAVTAGFFAACVAYVAGCEQL